MQNVPSYPLAFTLLELLITLSIGLVLFGLAMPSFNTLLSTNRLTTSINEWVTDLNYARSEAIKRGQQVVLRKTFLQWEQGWQIFVDIDRSTSAHKNVLDTTDILLRVHSALPANFTLRGNKNFTNFIRFKSDGTSSNFGSFVICDNRDGDNLPKSYTSRLVTVNAAFQHCIL